MRSRLGFLVALSLGLHVIAAVAVSRRAPAALPPPPAAPVELTEVELAPLGVPAGVEGARVAGRSADARAGRRADAPRARGGDEPEDDGFRPAKKRGKARHDDKPASPDVEAERERLRDAVRKSILEPDDKGSGEDARRGAPDGAQGGAKAGGMGSYRGVLSGWFNARVAGGGGGGGEPHELLRAIATITLTPERRVASFSLKGSGNAAYDARIQGKLAAIVASGATLPAPPDGEDVPPQIRVAFSCRPNERCY